MPALAMAPTRTASLREPVVQNRLKRARSKETGWPIGRVSPKSEGIWPVQLTSTSFVANGVLRHDRSKSKRINRALPLNAASMTRNSATKERCYSPLSLRSASDSFDAEHRGGE
ncbi:MAG: hypothetical protein ACR2PI_08820 [Hyphomicrobiaceae bacterium]